MLKQADSTKKKWKPGIVDSQESFLVVTCAATIQSTISARTERYFAMGLSNQAYIIGVGDNISTVTYYLIVLDTIIYRTENIIKAIDIAFKMQFVLYIGYPQESHLVWLFIQNYFYDIKLQNDKQATAVTCLIRDLK